MVEEFCEHGSLADGRLFRRSEQRQLAPTGDLTQVLQGRSTLWFFQLSVVAGRELFESFGVVGVPFSQLR